MKKTTLITLAIIISMVFNVAYAQYEKPFDTEKEARKKEMAQRMEKQRKIAQCPLYKSKHQKAETQAVTSAEFAREEALDYVRKIQDIEMEDSLLTINTSDTTHTISVFKYMLYTMKNRFRKMVLEGYTMDEVRSVYMNCRYINTVLCDYFDDITCKSNDIGRERTQFIYEMLNYTKTVSGLFDTIHRIRRPY